MKNVRLAFLDTSQSFHNVLFLRRANGCDMFARQLPVKHFVEFCVELPVNAKTKKGY